MSHVDLSARFTLHRFPKTDAETPLQAWEAADDYLLQQVDKVSGPVVIFNDAFGALACALHQYQPVSVSDSVVAQLATRQNLMANDLDDEQVTLQDCLAPLPAAPALVIIKIPKQLALLEQQLVALREVCTPETRIIAGAKARDVHNSTLALFERILGPTTTSLAWKKARLIHCTFAAPALVKAPETQSWPLDGTPWTIHNHANVFSRNSLDIGARLFLNHLPQDQEGELVDLGCGNGVIGLMLLAKNPEAKVTFVDESYMAVESSRLNVETNLPEDLERCEFIANDSLSGLEANRFNAVFCNPPFHQEHAVTDHIAWQMFNDARRCLQWGGALYIVGNRHLGYHQKLKRVFGNCNVVGSSAKFVVLKAVKVRKSR